MATAEELLRNSAIQPNPEGHIIVGGDRRITIPENLKRLGVQYDHNMETVTFDCPRYWDNKDMSKMAIYINYMRSDRYADRYPVDNIQVDGDIMHFDWTISRNVTEVAGLVSFIVCIMKTDANGDEERHWNSELCQEAYISPGMETEVHPALNYPDEVTQLLLRMNTVEQINVQAEEMNAILAEAQETAAFAEQTKNQALDTSNYIKNSYANAVKGYVSGEIIRVDDVSPIEHQVKCRVHGKNLFDISKLTLTSIKENEYSSRGYISKITENSVTITTNDEHTSNGYTITGKKLRELCPGLRAGDTFIMSANTESISKYFYLSSPHVGTVAFGQTYVATEDMLDSGVILYGFRSSSGTQGIGDCVISNIQLELGTQATNYEPYLDPSTTTLTQCGTNIIPYPYTDTTVTRKGVTFTDNKDGTITINGTAEATTSFVLFNGEMLVNGKYTLSGLTGGSGSTYYIQPVCSDKAHRGVTDGPNTYDWYNMTLNRIQLSVVVGTVFSNLRIKPMLEFGESASSFERYEGDGISLPSDGTCVVTSKSPTMTLFTDTPGVIVEAEYNIDTVKFLNGIITDERIQAATDAWLTAHYAEAEGVSF